MHELVGLCMEMHVYGNVLDNVSEFFMFNDEEPTL